MPEKTWWLLQRDVQEWSKQRLLSEEIWERVNGSPWKTDSTGWLKD